MSLPSARRVRRIRDRTQGKSSYHSEAIAHCTRCFNFRMRPKSKCAENLSKLFGFKLPAKNCQQTSTTNVARMDNVQHMMSICLSSTYIFQIRKRPPESIIPTYKTLETMFAGRMLVTRCVDLASLDLFVSISGMPTATQGLGTSLCMMLRGT